MNTKVLKLAKARVPLSAKLLVAVLKRIKYGSLELQTPDGEVLHFYGDDSLPKAHIKLLDWKVCTIMLLKGDIGFGEAYRDGLWTSEEISLLIRIAVKNQEMIKPIANGLSAVTSLYRFKHRQNKNTKQGSKKNIHAHYDLGNDFYSRWLDSSMTYSSGIFTEETKTLAEAQVNKFQRIIDELGLSEGDRVLEIGCGWGGFAEYAAGKGIHVKGVTISKEQLIFAKKRCAHLSDLVRLEFCDYRDLTGKYDYVVSIEMFEALGASYWNTYFKKVRSLLNKGGKALIQSITINEVDFDSYLRGTDFIQQYIFPGGMLPSVAKFCEQARRNGLALTSQLDFAGSYAKTLSLWQESFESQWNDIKTLGFDESFRNTWNFYLKYCEGGFLENKIGVSQFLLERK